MEKIEQRANVDLVKSIFDSKFNQDKYVTPNLLKMKGWIESLKDLDFDLGDGLAISIILASLHDGCSNFHVKYNT